MRQLFEKRLSALVMAKRGSFYHYLFAVVLVWLAYLARIAISPPDSGLTFLTFFPAVALVAIIGGIWPGLFATAISMVLVTYLFIAPSGAWTFEFKQATVLINIVFLADGLIVCAAIEVMHRYYRDYIETADALSKSREHEARVNAANKELDEFAYIASHDLKEPLRGIHNYASFLKEDHADRLDEEARRYIDRIQQLAERMSDLIEHLLAYSRLGYVELARAPVDTNAVVDAVAEDLKPLLDSQGVELRRTGHLPVVKGDAIRIRQVFQNLIANAVKYNDKPVKWVEVGCDNNRMPPLFYVRDNGIGIAPHHQDAVFQIFKRLHEQNKYGGGAGAGLTITRKIIERHGGRIWLESVSGEGTSFYFTLNGGA
ncbi:MAG TPA: ATP-binding protein [Gallionella sp.]|nr:ATP-binding protein [Gallionella sp.]